ncbi:MAG: type II toxin-antitoxin system RatA family toxin [Pseudomonadota bacterium]
MPKLDKVHTVQHQAKDMFELVCDVEKYPQFVPLVASLVVKSKKEKADKTLMLADMTMAYKMLSETFTTQVLIDPQNLKIDVKYIDGPFKHLDNHWRFTDLPDGSCEIGFMVDYELKNKMLALAAGAVFEMAFSRFVDAFENRANEIYGHIELAGAK